MDSVEQTGGSIVENDRSPSDVEHGGHDEYADYALWDQV